MKIRIDNLALNEYFDAIKWYELQSKGLEIQFKATVRGQIKLIKRNPSWFLIEEDNIFKAYLPKFPYKILYTVNSEEKLITIWAFAHLHKKPWYWQKRLKNSD